MVNLKRAILFILILSLSACQPDSDIKATQKLSQDVIKQIEGGDIESAFDLLSQNWPLSQSEIDTLKAHTQKNRQNLSQRYGQVLSIEYLGSQRIGNSFVRHVFLEKFEKHAIQWEFSFYKPLDKWVMNSMFWDDKITPLYDRDF